MEEKRKLIESIIGELNSRKGFDNWWYNIDEDIREEIIISLIDKLPSGNKLSFREAANPMLKYLNENHCGNGIAIISSTSAKLTEILSSEPKIYDYVID